MLKKTKDITRSVWDTNFIFECWKYLSVSEANKLDILSAREDKIRILKCPYNILSVYFIDTDKIST